MRTIYNQRYAFQRRCCLFRKHQNIFDKWTCPLADSFNTEFFAAVVAHQVVLHPFVKLPEITADSPLRLFTTPPLHHFRDKHHTRAQRDAHLFLKNLRDVLPRRYRCPVGLNSHLMELYLDKAVAHNQIRSVNPRMLPPSSVPRIWAFITSILSDAE